MFSISLRDATTFELRKNSILILISHNYLKLHWPYISKHKCELMQCENPAPKLTQVPNSLPKILQVKLHHLVIPYQFAENFTLIKKINSKKNAVNSQKNSLIKNQHKIRLQNFALSLIRCSFIVLLLLH